MGKINKNRLLDYATKIAGASENSMPDPSPIYSALGYFSEMEHPISDLLKSLAAEIGRSSALADWIAVSRGMTSFSASLFGLYDALDPEVVNEPDGTPYFKLTVDEEKLVLDLAADMRRAILDAQCFDQPWKLRLLKRVSAIEFEVHRSKGRLDVVLGGLGDVGEALGKFGNDVKPILDRMAEIAKITRRKSSEYDQLPAPEEQKRLPKPNEE